MMLGMFSLQYKLNTLKENSHQFIKENVIVKLYGKQKNSECSVGMWRNKTHIDLYATLQQSRKSDKFVHN